MKCVIGIISYLPDDKTIRNERKNKLKYLLYKCSIHFNLPIIIIAQNWSEKDKQDLQVKSGNIMFFDKLGIVGARKKLREVFLSSDYDYLIMLDDDCKIDCTINGVKTYLKEIEEHPDGYGLFYTGLLKLFAISKSKMSLVDYPNICVENGDGFEDKIFINELIKKFPEDKFMFSAKEIWEDSISTQDPYSTWYVDQDLSLMNKNTINIIK